jgi:MOSC domain-containing protein YiiM
MNAVVIAVARNDAHAFSKPARDAIELREGFGIEGDAHAGSTVQHLSRIAVDPTAPNLRQVHLIHAELHDELETRGFTLAPGAMGENIVTRGIDLLGLARGTVLHIGTDAAIQITGLRNPCAQLDKLQRGLLAAVLDRDAAGGLVRKSGIMAIVRKSGLVRPGDKIRIEAPQGPFVALAPV